MTMQVKARPLFDLPIVQRAIIDSFRKLDPRVQVRNPVMFVGRFWLAIPVLAIAGALAAKKAVPAGAGTLPTYTPLFVTFLIGVILIVGVLTFVPALALGPIVEHLQIYR